VPILTLTLVVTLSMALLACGGSATDTAAETSGMTVGEQPAMEPAAEEELQEVEQRVREQGEEGPGKSGGKDSEAIGGIHCGGGLSVGPNTSCPFAQNVRWAYESSGGHTHISAYSPVTGQTYRMTCGPGADVATVCTGGNDATVYFN
jgi:hypothetical protein